MTITGRSGAGIYALWDDPAEDAANRDWVRRVDAALAPLRTGRYVGEADLTVAPDRLAARDLPQLERRCCARARGGGAGAAAANAAGHDLRGARRQGLEGARGR